MMKEARIVDIRKRPSSASGGFSKYADFVEYWRSAYGYELPSAEPPAYISVVFPGRNNRPPLTYVRNTEPETALSSPEPACAL